MKIDVVKKNFSIGDKYDIFINKEHAYYASKAFFQLLAKIKLSREKDSEPLVVINKQFTPFTATYTITMPDGSVLDFSTISTWKFQYQCIHGEDTYDIYGNSGLKYSIYKNDKQVAFFTEPGVTVFNGEKYNMYADDNCNKELLVAFCLVIDNYANNGRKNTLNFNLGNVGFGLKKFDPDWKPNQSKN